MQWRTQEKISGGGGFQGYDRARMGSRTRVWTKNTMGWGIFEKILKIFDENSMGKWNFYIFLGKVVKNRALGNNIIFLQLFFPVREGALRTPLLLW